jgi:hypothetical protein
MTLWVDAVEKAGSSVGVMCLVSFDPAEMGRLLVLSGLISDDFDADVTDLRKAMRAAGRVVGRGIEAPRS